MRAVRPSLLVLGLAAALLLASAGGTVAAPERATAPLKPSGDPLIEVDLPWNSLSAAERRSLAPLERDWVHLPPQQRQLWVELAQRLPTMNPDRRQRIQARMAEWSRMTPTERGQARLRFIQSQRTGSEDREKRWDDYKALPSEQKKEFAARAAAPASAAAPEKLRSGTGRNSAADSGTASGTVKSNLVPNPNFAVQPKTIAPTMLKAGPGASTTAVTKTATPPSHQQIGLPKIAATPGFVDRSTLLPKRGPQGAAATPVNEESVEKATLVPRP